jgi:hypothetical protein
LSTNVAFSITAEHPQLPVRELFTIACSMTYNKSSKIVFAETIDLEGMVEGKHAQKFRCNMPYGLDQLESMSISACCSS